MTTTDPMALADELEVAARSLPAEYFLAKLLVRASGALRSAKHLETLAVAAEKNARLSQNENHLIDAATWRVHARKIRETVAPSPPPLQTGMELRGRQSKRGIGCKVILRTNAPLILAASPKQTEQA